MHRQWADKPSPAAKADNAGHMQGGDNDRPSACMVADPSGDSVFWRGKAGYVGAGHGAVMGA